MPIKPPERRARLGEPDDPVRMNDGSPQATGSDGPVEMTGTAIDVVRRRAGGTRRLVVVEPLGSRTDPRSRRRYRLRPSPAVARRSSTRSVRSQVK